MKSTYNSRVFGSVIHGRINVKRKIRLRQKNNLELMAMSVIPLCVLICFSYIPMIGLILAFKNFNYVGGIFGSPWCGFNNFKFLFANSDVMRITKNTLILNLLFIFTTTAGGVIFAIILNEIRSKTALKIYQTCIFLPYILSASIVAYVVFSLLNADYGLVNAMLKKAGREAILWYSEPKYWYAILVLTNFWKGIGYSTIIYFASVISIDGSYYEAATIDGANWLQSHRYVTIPMIMPMVITLTIMNVGHVFYSDFGLFYMVPKNTGALYPATDVIDTYVYRALSDGDFGKSAAVGLYQSLVGFILVFVANRLAKSYDKNSAIF